MRRSKLLKLMVATTALVPMGGAFAADEGAQPPQGILITATRRAQPIQTVPATVNVVSPRGMEGTNAKSLKDVQDLAPGLLITSTMADSYTNIRIRGVGTVGDNPGLETSVGIVIDGVHRPRGGVAYQNLYGVERIEVVKGPQTSLFGKSTSAGVIEVISKKAAFEPSGHLTLGGGNFDQKSASFYSSGTLVSGLLAGSLSVAYDEAGPFNTVLTGKGPRTSSDDQRTKTSAIRGELLFKADDSLNIRLIADYTDSNYQCCVAVPIRVGPTGAIINALAGGKGTGITAEGYGYANRPTGSSTIDAGVTAIVEKTALNDRLKISSITGFRYWKNNSFQDLDFTTADILYRGTDSGYGMTFKTFSQEVKAVYKATNGASFLGGLYFENERLDRLDVVQLGRDYESYLSLLLSSGGSAAFVSGLTGLPVGRSYAEGVGSKDRYLQESKDIAVFGSAELPITSKTKLVIDGRYGWNEKSLQGFYANTDNAVACSSAASRLQANAGTWAVLPAAAKGTVLGNLCLFWDNAAFNSRVIDMKRSKSLVTGGVKIVHEFNDHVMAYGSYVIGAKNGGFNQDRAQIGISPDNALYFDRERNASAEMGFRAQNQSRRITLNGTAFAARIQNYQLNSFISTSYVVESIPLVKSSGYELEAKWLTPIKYLTVIAGTSYTDTRYADFTADRLMKAARYPALSLLPNSGIAWSPKYTYSATVNYRSMIGPIQQETFLSALATSSYLAGSDLAPYKRQDGQTMINASIKFTKPNSPYAVTVWGRNLGDERRADAIISGPMQGSTFQSTLQPNGTYYDAAKDTNTYVAFLTRPRSYGVNVSVKW